MKTIELPHVPNVLFCQKYFRRYESNFTGSKRYKTNPTKYDAKIKASNFFFGTDGSILSYMKRKNVVDKTDVYEEELKEKGVDERDILNYMKDRPGSTGLFDVEGSLDEKRAKLLDEFLATTPNMGWGCVLSFLPEYSNENVDNPYQAQKLLTVIVPEQLKAQGLDPKDFYWFGAYHINTDHRHVHYVIVPKTEFILPKAYTDKEIIEEMPKIVERYFPLKENHFPLDRDYFMEEYSKDFEELSPRLINSFNDIIIKKKQYRRLNKEERQIVNSVTWNVLNRDKSLKKGLEMLKTWAKETEEKVITHKNSIGEPLTYEEENFAKITYYAFMNRIYNKTLKLMNDIDPNIKESLSAEENKINKLNRKPIVHLPSQDKNAIRNRSMYRRKRHPKEKLSTFIRRLISESANYALFDLNGSFSELWDELDHEIMNDYSNAKEENNIELI